MNLSFLIAAFYLLQVFSGTYYQSMAKEFVPPGTAKINDTLYADISEVTVQTWSEYRSHIKLKYGAESNEYLSTQPDSTVWVSYSMISNEPYRPQHPGSIYKDHPVAGISYEQAIDFCRWRTAFVRAQMDRYQKFPGISLQYRLPAPSEWEYFAHTNPEVFNFQPEVKRVKAGKDRSIYKIKNKANIYLHDTLPGRNSVSTKNYKENFFHLYDIIGNVAEMTSVKGVCKGGSWFHTLEESRPGRNITYRRPEPWLGFRAVCVIKKY